MKLLIITPGKLPVPATSGGAVETLIQTLIDDNEKSKLHDITLISVYTKDAYEASKKYKHTHFQFIDIHDKFYKFSRAFRYVMNRIPFLYIGNAYIHRVYNLLKNNEKDYDYVIVENSPQYSLILKKIFKNNLIFHSHNDFLNKDIPMAKKILNTYNKVFSLSDYISNRIRQIDTNYKNVYTLYNGIELDKFEVQEDIIIKKKLNIKDNDFVYLYTGRIVEVKGVRELIKAFNLIKDNNSKLVIVGDMDNVPVNTRSYVNELKRLSYNNSNIIFTGRVSYSEIPKYYKSANVGVVPSIWEEPFALTVIEHMAVGNPVIVSNSGAMPELVNDTCAVIVDKEKDYINNLYSALVKIKQSYHKYNPENIMKEAHKFSSTKYCDTFNKLLKK